MKFNLNFSGIFFALILSILLSSCSGIIGYGVLLWNDNEHKISDGTVVPVYLKSNISKVYVIALPDTKEKVEVPLWQLSAPEKKSRANKLAAKYAEYKAKSSNTEVLESSNGTTTEDEDIADSSSASSQDWDAMLDSYEEYVDKYISLLKKAGEGDMTAMTEYPALMSKAQEFCDKMENAKGSMSASQLVRYTKITEKMLKAAQK